MPTNQPKTSRRDSGHDTAARPHSGSVAPSARWNGSTSRARRSSSGIMPTGEHATRPATGCSAAHATARGAPNECPITTGRSHAQPADGVRHEARGGGERERLEQIGAAVSRQIHGQDAMRPPEPLGEGAQVGARAGQPVQQHHRRALAPLRQVDTQTVDGECPLMHDREATSRVAADEYRKRSALNWEQAAAGWESESARVREMGGPITAWLIEHLELAPGVTVLELASGPGDVGLAVAAALGGDGTVILSDRAHAMVEAARRAAAAAGITNAEMRVLDAESLDLADESVDRVVCRFAYMLVADRAAAFRETRRVLRPGGRVAFAVWATAAENEWATTLWDVLEGLTDLPPTPPGGPGCSRSPIPMSSAGSLRMPGSTCGRSSRSRSRGRTPTSTPTGGHSRR